MGLEAASFVRRYSGKPGPEGMPSLADGYNLLLTKRFSNLYIVYKEIIYFTSGPLNNVKQLI